MHGEAFAPAFVRDGHLVGFDGSDLKGRKEIASFHQPLFGKWLKGTRLVGEVTSVRFLAPDVAVMHTIGGTIMGNQSKPSPSSRFHSNISRSAKEQWIEARSLSKHKVSPHRPQLRINLTLDLYGLAVDEAQRQIYVFAIPGISNSRKENNHGPRLGAISIARNRLCRLPLDDVVRGVKCRVNPAAPSILACSVQSR